MICLDCPCSVSRCEKRDCSCLCHKSRTLDDLKTGEPEPEDDAFLRLGAENLEKTLAEPSFEHGSPARKAAIFLMLSAAYKLGWHSSAVATILDAAQASKKASDKVRIVAASEWKTAHGGRASWSDPLSRSYDAHHRAAHAYPLSDGSWMWRVWSFDESTRDLSSYNGTSPTREDAILAANHKLRELGVLLPREEPNL